LSIKNALDLSLHVLLEVSDKGIAIKPVLVVSLVVLLELCPHIFRNFDLHCVVTWGDGLNVPFKLGEVTVTLEVVENSQVDKDEEDTGTRDNCGHAMLFCQDIICLLTSVGDEDSCILVSALLRDFRGVNNVKDFLGCELEQE